MYIDTHSHLSEFSSDGRQSAAELLAAAAKKRLAGICTTDHFEYGVFYHPGREEVFSLDEYFKLLVPLRRQQAHGRPRLLIGIELGYMPAQCERYALLAKSFDFDSIIMSLHLFDGDDPYVDDSIYKVGKKAVYRRYLERLNEMITVCPDHDIVGHFDYVSRYAPYDDRKMYYRELPEAFDQFFKTLIEHHKALEINTGTVEKMMDLGYEGSDAWPDKDIMDAYYRLGGRLISLGSDAHFPDQVGRYFQETASWLKDLGFRHLTHYEKRQPVQTRLS